MSQSTTTRTCLITGASSGLGFALSLELAQQSHRVYMLCRDGLKGRRALEAVRQSSGNAAVYLLQADLGDFPSVKAAARDFLDKESQLDFLLNNASILPKAHQLNANGIEQSFAVNHLGHYLLTHQLLDVIQQSARKKQAASHILNITSVTHRYGHLGFDDLQNHYSFQPLLAYSRSKLAQILFTYSLHERIAHQGIAVNCLHPGSLRTHIFRHQGAFLRGFNRLFSRSPTRIARFISDFLVRPENAGTSGCYFEGQRKKRSSTESRDPLLAEKVWRLSKELTNDDEQPAMTQGIHTIIDGNIEPYQLLTKDA